MRPSDIPTNKSCRRTKLTVVLCCRKPPPTPSHMAVVSHESLHRPLRPSRSRTGKALLRQTHKALTRKAVVPLFDLSLIGFPGNMLPLCEQRAFPHVLTSGVRGYLLTLAETRLSQAGPRRGVPHPTRLGAETAPLASPFCSHHTLSLAGSSPSGGVAGCQDSPTKAVGMLHPPNGLWAQKGFWEGRCARHSRWGRKEKG